ncbi:MAG TPA: hypothetical protein VLE93_02375 [Candidatus Saccharimonadales bacterium]|nr:hypothetical protein [Candidatus Saccharimonadales bacterium]
MMGRARRTPKVFNASYRPPPARLDLSQYRKLWPLFCLLALVVAFYIVGQLPAFRVQTVELAGGGTPELVAALQKLKGDSLLSGTLFADVTRVKNSLPTLSQLNCRRGIPGTLKCAVTLRHATLYWKAGDKIMAVDADGFAYAAATPPTGAIIIEDRGGSAPHLGQTVASRQTVEKYVELFTALTSSHLTTSQLFIGDSLFQVGASLTASTDPTVPFAANSPISALFTLDQPATGQVATLIEILKAKHDAIHDHVDLRVPGSAYVQ